MSTEETGHKELIDTLYAGRSWEIQAAQIIEQQAARIRELEEQDAKTVVFASENIANLSEQNAALAAKVSDLEADNERLESLATSIDERCGERIASLAAQMVQMKEALEKGHLALIGLIGGTRKEGYGGSSGCKEAANAMYDSLALSTTTAEEILRQHDAKVIERCAAYVAASPVRGEKECRHCNGSGISQISDPCICQYGSGEKGEG